MIFLLIQIKFKIYFPNHGFNEKIISQSKKLRICCLIRLYIHWYVCINILQFQECSSCTNSYSFHSPFSHSQLSLLANAKAFAANITGMVEEMDNQIKPEFTSLLLILHSLLLYLTIVVYQFINTFSLSMSL